MFSGLINSLNTNRNRQKGEMEAKFMYDDSGINQWAGSSSVDSRQWRWRRLMNLWD